VVICFNNGDVSTKTAGLITVKCMLNSVISTKNGRFMTGDLKDFYLGTDLDDYKYARIPVHLIPAHIITLYNLEDKIVNGHVYAEARKGMYGLPQAGRLVNDRLTKFLEPRGYVPCKHTYGLWRDTKSDLMFTLVVDDFGIRYTKKADAKRLMDTLKLQYKVSKDWEGSRYIGFTLKWDYIGRTVELSMPGYVERALLRFAHPAPTRTQDSPQHPWTAPRYGPHVQYAKDDQSPFVDYKNIKRLQEVIGTFLYYARAPDITMLVSLGTLASDQTKHTTDTLTAMTQLLNYAALHPDAVVDFRASDMVLHIESDASYLSESKGRSRFAGYHYLSDMPTDPTKAPHPDDPPPMHSGAIDIPYQIMDHVMASAAEAEFGTLFHNGKVACPHRTCLHELSHPQSPTPIVTDNLTAAGIANDTVKLKRSKAMKMRFYWIRDRVRQGQFVVYWQRGATNKADYFSKHHGTPHHRNKCYDYFKRPTAANYYDCLYDIAPVTKPNGNLLTSAIRAADKLVKSVLPLRSTA
jgi:hypothetical protein